MVSVPEIPPCMRQLPRDHTGRPIPYFVADVDGKRDFRVASVRAMRDALKYGLCWVCGRPFTNREPVAFTVGPMCGVNLVSSEPPAHRDCAVYSALACPFLSHPGMTRRERGLPDHVPAAGVMIERNPGVTLVWVTGRRAWSSFPAPGGILFRIGDSPVECLWFAGGRPATRAEVLASIETGLPALRAAADPDGPEAMTELDQAVERAMAFIPAEDGAS